MEGPGRSLVLTQPNGRGLSLGLMPGDRVVAVNGLPFEGTAAALAARMGRAGRERAVREFDWGAIAAQTVALYNSVR